MSACHRDRSYAKHDALSLQRGKCLPKIGGKADAQRGHGASGADGEVHPAVEKSGSVAISFTHIDVLSTGLREHSTQLGKGEASQQRHTYANDPNDQKEPGIARVGGDVLRGEEDP